MADAIKKWYQSKTIWANILLVVASIASAIAGQISDPTAGALSVAGIVNIVLRCISTQAVALK